VTVPSRLLLDTHVFLWWRSESSRLADEVRSRIATADIVFVSSVSAWAAWEAAIKASPVL
jgi:PIN domain nuclease of toxin-antitoxin system